MKVTSAEFIKSVVNFKHCPNDGLPEIAFVGRSNVGKSSLMNLLLGRKNLVKTSATPGKTQALNYFLINQRCYFVDMPGYGYAKVGQGLRKEWKELAEGYLKRRQELKLVLQLVDSRHPPTKDDQSMFAWLHEMGLPTLVVLTKLDKIPRTKQQAHVREAIAVLGVSEESLVPSSVPEKVGFEEIWGVIDAVLDEESAEPPGEPSSASESGPAT